MQRSGGSYREVFDDQPDLAAQKVQQHRNALAVGCALEQTETSSKHSIENADRLAAGELRLATKLHKTVSILPPSQAFDPIQKIGGSNGWYFGTLLWKLRGYLDDEAVDDPGELASVSLTYGGRS